MAYPYISGTDVETRIGKAPYKKIFDEDRSGVADATPVLQVCADASARVKGALRASRRYDLQKIDDDPPAEVIRLALDVAELYCCIRYPEVMRKNPEFLQRMVDKELSDLVSGKMLLDGAVDPVKDTDDRVVYAGGTPMMESDPGRGWC